MLEMYALMFKMFKSMFTIRYKQLHSDLKLDIYSISHPACRLRSLDFSNSNLMRMRP